MTKRTDDSELPDPESGVPGGGRGRRDKIDPTGVYPMSAGIPEGKHLEIRTPAAWGQGDRGAAGYYDTGESEMSIPIPPRSSTAKDAAPTDLDRVTQQTVGRLSALGIALSGGESPDQISQIAEAVERFEDAVEARGGDLMIDEPPPGSAGRGDVSDFVLPRRAADESIAAYVARLDRATERVLQY